MLILVDSGILLRLMERADPQHGVIRHAIRTHTARGDELVTAFQNVAEFWNVCTRPTTSRGGRIQFVTSCSCSCSCSCSNRCWGKRRRPEQANEQEQEQEQEQD